MMEPNEVILEEVIGLVEALRDDLHNVVLLYTDGKIQEALDEGERIIGGIMHLADNPRFMICMSILYPPRTPEEGLPEGLNPNVPIN